MAEHSGVLYGFYTNKPIDAIFDLLKKEMSLQINYESEYNSYKGEESLLFYKNKNMLDHHLEYGYNLDLDDQGCFCIEAKMVNLHGIASLFEFEGDSNFEPYDINLLFDKVPYYVLILPDFIEKSNFCLQIHNLFVKTVKNFL